MAFSLKGLITLDNSGFIKGVQDSESASSRLAGATKTASAGIGKMVKAGLGIAGVALGVKDTLSTFTDFQKEMSNVQALTGETSQVQMKALNEKAKEMGRILPASASEAAQAMANLGSAGFTTDEIMKSIEGTLYLATSAQTDMATAADITSGTLRGFGLEAWQAEHVSDVLAKTAADTNSGILDLGESLKYSAPVAHAMGISLEEVSAATGIMANSNIKGSQSGTTLRGALTRLVKPSEAAASAMERIGFTAIDSEGNMKSLTQIVSELKSGTKDLTQEERNSALASIFGQEALSGMLALVDAGPEKLGGLTKALEKADGASKQMAETQTNNLYGALQDIEGAFETLKINIGEQAAPALTGALKGIAEVLPSLGENVVGVVSNFMAFGAELYDNIKPTLMEIKDFVMTEVVPRFSELGSTISDIAETYAPLLEMAFDSFKEAAGLAVTEGLDAFNNALRWVADNSEFVVGALTAIGTGYAIYKAACIAATIAQGIQNISFGFGIIQSGLLSAGIVALYVKDYALAAAHGIATAAQWALNIAMTAGAVPIALVVGGLALLVGGVVLAYNKLDWFRGIVDTVWGVLKGFGETVASVFRGVGKLAGKIGGFIGIGGEKNANGTSYFGGGVTAINERGDEMQVLRDGTSILTAERTDQLLRGDGAKQGNNVTINIDAKGMDVNELADVLELRLSNL